MGAKAEKGTESRELPLRVTEDRGGAAASWMLWGFFVVLLAGAALFRGGRTMVGGNELSVERTVFTVVNAATLTGFQQSIHTNMYLLLGQAIVVALTVAGTLVSLIVGGMAVCRILRLPYTDGQIARAAVACQVAAAVLGAVLLYEPETRNLWQAAALGVAGFGNSGLYLGEPMEVLGWRTHLVVLPLMVLGGLGLTVLLELANAARGRRAMSMHGRTVLGMTAGLYLVALLIFGLFSLMGLAQRVGVDSLAGIQVREAVASSSAAALGARTGGIALPFRSLFPLAFLEWAAMALMIIGASSGGTGGGLKTTTVAQLWLGAGRALRGEKTGRAFGLATAWTAAYAAVVFVALLMLIHSEPDMRPDRLLFLTISAASNVGWSHEPISIAGTGLYTLSAVMLFGRIAPLLLLWHMARTTDDAEMAVG